MYQWGFCDRCTRYDRRCKLKNGKCSMVIEEENKQNELELKASVKINAYRIIDDAVERAVTYGYRRAHKHADRPTEQHIVQEIQRAVMNDLCEILKFDE